MSPENLIPLRYGLEVTLTPSGLQGKVLHLGDGPLGAYARVLLPSGRKFDILTQNLQWEGSDGKSED